MIPFHPDLITTVHDDRMATRRTARPRRGEDVRWVRRGRTARPAVRED